MFNVAHPESIPYMEVLFRSLFKDIIYCLNIDLKGKQFKYRSYDLKFSDPTNDLTVTRSGKNMNLIMTLTFNETGKAFEIPLWATTFTFNTRPVGWSAHGESNYECVESAQKEIESRELEAEGLLVINDDLLLNPSKFHDLDPKRIWYETELPQTSIMRKLEKYLKNRNISKSGYVPPQPHNNWPWVKRYVNQMMQVISFLRGNGTLNSFPMCKSRILDYQIFYAQLADFYYLPMVSVHHFTRLSRVFRAANLWLEIAVPTILHCLPDAPRIQGVGGYFNWDYGGNRDLPWVWFKDKFKKTFIHPIKFGALADNHPKIKSFFCSELFPAYFSATTQTQPLRAVTACPVIFHQKTLVVKWTPIKSIHLCRGLLQELSNMTYWLILHTSMDHTTRWRRWSRNT